MLRHVLPNIAPLVLAQATLSFAYAMVDLAAISFVGLGTQPPTPDWGTMVAAGQSSVLRGSPEQSIAAGAAIVLAVVALNVIGEAGAARGTRRAA